MIKINRFLSKLEKKYIKTTVKGKADSELEFWQNTLVKLIRWYLGEIDELYGEAHPSDDQKILAHNLKDSAILTWGKIHQETKYLQDLALGKDAFSGMRLLDIGSGPFPSALAFVDCTVYCLDPLLPGYLAAGFPIHYYDRVHFVHAHSEDIPCPDHYFDAIISVNALDHVDDFEKTVLEIQRVLKPEGKLRFHLHYHSSTPLEPIEFNDQKMMQSFRWCPNFRKVYESKEKRGNTLPAGNEVYAVWSNF